VRHQVVWGQRDEPEPEPELKKPEQPEVDWHVVIRAAVNAALAEERRRSQEALAEAIAYERKFHHEVMAEVIAQIRDDAKDDLEHAVRLLTVELADLKVTLAEVRLAFATDRTQALELPNPLPKRAELN
jgi:hypothetical protein